MRLVIQALITVVCICIILRVFAFITHKRMNAGLVQVQASDLTTYYVKDLENKQEAAELLASTRKKLFAVVETIRTMEESTIPVHLSGGLKRLVRRHCHNLHMNELDASQYKTVAMNRQKGLEIHVCLRKCPDCIQLTQADRLFIVALHELAHSATDGYDPNVGGVTQHGDEFKRYERFVVDVAKKQGLLDEAAVIGTNYCGIEIPPITDPPL